MAGVVMTCGCKAARRGTAPFTSLLPTLPRLLLMLLGCWARAVGSEGPPYLLAAGQRPLTCGRVVEGRTLSLVCPDTGGVIEEVAFASYGTPSGECHPSGSNGGGSGGGGSSLSVGRCHMARSTRLVEDACLGRHSCSVVAANEVFGEPCYGTTVSHAAHCCT